MASSIHLNSLDFLLWRYLKSQMYSSPINDSEELRSRIHQTCQIIQQRCEIFERVHDPLRRYQACIEVEGGYVENLL
ncbi:hypothetical protein ANTQUA_LOCUS4074 [Anthophora quadrimaculata]